MLESKYGSPRIVNDGVTVAKEVELEDPVENIGAKLVRQVLRPSHSVHLISSKHGHSSTTSSVKLSVEVCLICMVYKLLVHYRALT